MSVCTCVCVCVCVRVCVAYRAPPQQEHASTAEALGYGPGVAFVPFDPIVAVRSPNARAALSCRFCRACTTHTPPHTLKG